MAPEMGDGGPANLPPDEFPDLAHALGESRRSTEDAVFAGGCFWCVEAVFRELQGVLEVTPGYSGGSAQSAHYETVCSGRTAHVEAVRIRFDPRRIGYGALLKVFFAIAHDPTQRDRQGPDRGPQYRSVIFHTNEMQQAMAEAYIRQLTAARVFPAPIVTEVAPLMAFYPAEDYHHRYAARNQDNPYIRHVAWPKVEKFRRYFSRLVGAPDQSATK